MISTRSSEGRMDALRLELDNRVDRNRTENPRSRADFSGWSTCLGLIGCPRVF
ncbi:hypothetical protein AG1IA_01407 [Rhizoctonia solani AG-1 IA]|uniref:Uncharacterized protein n=1 Tax=Thanatephorus cucumeris (strain AG1-IA) TaxID=983506 RepID=L8X640_THACA|nr:hypothetical protein AG1IA_01407 [Rhizoctonia solani AG-1 IA]